MCSRMGGSSAPATRRWRSSSSGGAMPSSAMRHEHSPMSAVVEFPVAAEVQPYLDAFRAPAGEPLWLVGQRRRSLARFAADGFPSRRGEAWRYLDLRGL